MAKKLSLSTQSTEVKKLIICISFSYYNFGETVTNLGKHIFRKESLIYVKNLKRSFLSDFASGCKVCSLPPVKN